MLLLALAIAPGIAICLFIYSLNKYGKGSLSNLVIAFVLGMAGTLPPLLLQMLAGDVRDEPSRHSVLSYAWYAFIVVAFSEEGTKFLLLRWYAFPKRSFNEPFDGIVYAVMIGMGFATVENVEYVRQFGLETGISRFFLAVPAHASFAVLLGYYVGWAKFEPERSVWLMGKGLGIVVILHGSFDFFLFLQQNRAVTKYVSAGMLSFGAFASFYIAVRMAGRAIRMHRALMAEEEPIRLADVDDIAVIGWLAQQIWPSAYGEILSSGQLEYMLDLFYSPAALRRQMLEDNHQFLLVEEDGEPVGFAAWSALAEPGVYKLHKLYVLPGLQGKGTGRAILQYIFGEIPEARVLRLNVNRYNKARLFYEKMGFAIVGEEDIGIGNGYFMNDYVMEIRFPAAP